MCDDVGSGQGALADEVEVKVGYATELHIVDFQIVRLPLLQFELAVDVHRMMADTPSRGQCITVDDDAIAVVDSHIQDDGLVCFRDEGALVFCAVVLQIHAWSEDRSASVVLDDGLGVVVDGSRCAFHFGVVPIGGTHSSSSVGRLEFIDKTFFDNVPRQSASFDEAGLRRFGLNALKNRHGVGGIAVIVAPHHGGVAGVLSHHDDALAL